ncbi:MAG: hypothetical protein ACI3V0_07485 [Faecousia sp.]
MKLEFIKGLFGAVGMLVLILDGETALQGATAGIDLCLRTVIPSLFPFLFLCAMLTDSLWGSSFRWLRPIARRLGIPSGAESLLIAALLGGYPAGAQQIGQACREGKLTKEDGAHLLTFCSNAGPAFLFGITATSFSSLSWVWALWLIQILAAMVTGRLGASGRTSHAAMTGKARSISQLLLQTTKTMGLLCGWILLFQILLAFLNRWFFWSVPETVQVILAGLLELSSGCCALERISEEHIRFLVCSGILSFGGLCVAMQTAAVIGDLPMGPYLRGKVIQTGLSLVFAAVFLGFGWTGLALLLPVFLLPWKKGVDFSKKPVYNACITTGRENPCCFVKK